MSRFISPAINRRKDEFGLTTDNRSRILIDILNGIRQKAPSLHISIKINSNDFTYNGLNEDESLIICKLLDDAGIDSIEVSGNGTSVRGIKPKINEGYFVPFAKILSESVKCSVMVVGGFRSKEIMENVLNNSKIELISLSRPLIREPELPSKMKEDSNYISKCISCNGCYSSIAHKCIFRGRN